MIATYHLADIIGSLGITSCSNRLVYRLFTSKLRPNPIRDDIERRKNVIVKYGRVYN